MTNSLQPFMHHLFKSNFWRRLTLLCWAVGATVQAQGQEKSKDKGKPAAPTQTHRVELESDAFDQEHWVHPLPDSTLLVVTLQSSTWFSKEDFTLTKYSDHLQPLWTTQHEQRAGTNLLHITQDQQRLYLLFGTREPKKLLLYTVDPATGSATVSEHLLPSSYMELQEMKAVAGQVFLYGLEYSKINMLHLNPAEEEIRMLPAVFGMEDDLGEFRVDTLTNAVEFVVGESNGWRSRVQTKRLTAQGDVIGTYFLQPRDPDNNLQPARLTAGDTLSKLLIGPYGYRTNIFAKGLFTGDLSGNLKYFEFSDLEHFFEYTTPRRQKRLKEKFAKLEAQGKPLILRYRLLLHPIMRHPQGYALVGEIYYPQYSNNGYTTPGPTDFGNSTFSRRVSEGFRFSHAIACVFDRQGNLLWDNAFRLENKTYPELAPTIEAGVLPNGDIAMVYPEEEFLRYKTLKPGVSLSNDEKVEVRQQAETDKMVSSQSEGIVHWYGGNFVAFGFQRVRAQDGKARNIFYLQNIHFE